MNVLLWAFTSLQWFLPSLNIPDLQIPGYDFMGGPRPRPAVYLTPARVVPRANGLYTCVHGVYFNQPTPCQFHNGLELQHCTYKLPSGKRITCIEWKGIQA